MTRLTDDDLATFKRNSGRGLPAKTLREMSQARGEQVDMHGEPIPKTNPGIKSKKKAAVSITDYRKAVVPSEHEECCALIEWAKTQVYRSWRVSEILIHIPNGAYHGRDREAGRVVAMKLRAQGLQAGVFDYLVPVPIRDSAGLWLEMKRAREGRVSEAQQQFKARMVQLGWQCAIARGWVEAAKAVTRYLNLSATIRYMEDDDV